MSLIASAIRLLEETPLPDPITKCGIDLVVGRARRRLSQLAADCEADFASELDDCPIASHTDAANAQHYELPPDFFALTLGPRCKYSCCLYPKGDETLADAETLALEETVSHAGLGDGQHILELGCGWGSLTLFMAERYPNARITAVSNSLPQRLHIEARARERGFENLTVVTADMNSFSPTGLFDRVVSVEMFEHMSNWRALLERIRRWLHRDGLLFVHVFNHRSQPYRFDHTDKADWIAKHFFTGGIMPSYDLMGQFPDCFEIEQAWRWSGRHYQRTAHDWLVNFDAHRARIDPILMAVYGASARRWRRRWRLFYLATAGLFGHAGGDEWGVSHYRLRPAAYTASAGMPIIGLAE
jgi:cyclopropane-fatty-acyl-phospholipid synthase